MFCRVVCKSPNCSLLTTKTDALAFTGFSLKSLILMSSLIWSRCPKTLRFGLAKILSCCSLFLLKNKRSQTGTWLPLKMVNSIIPSGSKAFSNCLKTVFSLALIME